METRSGKKECQGLNFNLFTDQQFNSWLTEWKVGFEKAVRYNLFMTAQDNVDDLNFDSTGRRHSISVAYENVRDQLDTLEARVIKFMKHKCVGNDQVEFSNLCQQVPAFFKVIDTIDTTQCNEWPREKEQRSFLTLRWKYLQEQMEFLKTAWTQSARSEPQKKEKDRSSSGKNGAGSHSEDGPIWLLNMKNEYGQKQLQWNNNWLGEIAKSAALAPYINRHEVAVHVVFLNVKMSTKKNLNSKKESLVTHLQLLPNYTIPWEGGNGPRLFLFIRTTDNLGLNSQNELKDICSIVSTLQIAVKGGEEPSWPHISSTFVQLMAAQSFTMEGEARFANCRTKFSPSFKSVMDFIQKIFLSVSGHELQTFCTKALDNAYYEYEVKMKKIMDQNLYTHVRLDGIQKRLAELLVTSMGCVDQFQFVVNTWHWQNERKSFDRKLVKAREKYWQLNNYYLEQCEKIRQDSRKRIRSLSNEEKFFDVTKLADQIIQECEKTLATKGINVPTQYWAPSVRIQCSKFVELLSSPGGGYQTNQNLPPLPATDERITSSAFDQRNESLNSTQPLQPTRPSPRVTWSPSQVSGSLPQASTAVLGLYDGGRDPTVTQRHLDGLAVTQHHHQNELLLPVTNAPEPFLKQQNNHCETGQYSLHQQFGEAAPSSQNRGIIAPETAECPPNQKEVLKGLVQLLEGHSQISRSVRRSLESAALTLTQQNPQDGAIHIHIKELEFICTELGVQHPFSI